MRFTEFGTPKPQPRTHPPTAPGLGYSNIRGSEFLRPFQATRPPNASNIKPEDFNYFKYPAKEIGIRASIAFIDRYEGYNSVQSRFAPPRMVNFSDLYTKNELISTFSEEPDFLTAARLCSLENDDFVLLLKRFSAPLSENDFLDELESLVKFSTDPDVLNDWPNLYREFQRFTSDFACIIDFMILPDYFGQQVPACNGIDGGMIRCYFMQLPSIFYNKVGRHFLQRLRRQGFPTSFSDFHPLWTKEVYEKMQKPYKAARILGNPPSPAEVSLDSGPYKPTREFLASIERITNAVVINQKLEQTDSHGNCYLLSKLDSGNFKICYAYFLTGKCPKGGTCEYSHKLADITAYRARLYEQIGQHDANFKPQRTVHVLHRPAKTQNQTILSPIEQAALDTEEIESDEY
jgi:hypothetical protein